MGCVRSVKIAHSYKEVRTVKYEHGCDERCQGAHSTVDKCKCECGGENHGLIFLKLGYKRNEKGQLVSGTDNNRHSDTQTSK